VAPKSDESSSDLNRAREISRRLAEREKRPAPKPAAAPAPGPAHRFSAEQVRAAAGLPAPPAPASPAASAPAASAPAPARAAPPPRPLPPLPAGGGWDALVAWCRSALLAESAFLIDDQGLLVASAGKIDAREAEGIGGRLVFTLEQADEMKGDALSARAITLEYGGSCLSGWRVPIAGGVSLTLGVLGARPPGPDAGAIVARAFAGKRAPSAGAPG
jgi:hypothetical protein